MSILRRLSTGAVTTALCLLFMLAGILSSTLHMPSALTIGLFLTSYITGGAFSTMSALAALKKLEIEVDLLMVLAALGAAALGKWSEGATLLFLFSLSNTLQEYAMDRTRKAIEAIMELRPDTALRRAEDGSEAWVPVDELLPGDRVVVRAGDRVPIDGSILEGDSSVDQSPITGESVPSSKVPGDELFAGSINLDGTVLMQVTKPASDTVLARIIKRVAESENEKAKAHQLIDTIEKWYALSVIGITILAAVVPILLGHDHDQAIYRALTIMVVASPCAVAIAAPSAILSAIANSARHGILFKGGRHLDALSRVKVVAFDKTGTLTRGKPRLLAVTTFGEASEQEVLGLAAAAERHSQHPIGQAIVTLAREWGITIPEPSASRAVAGRGLVATIDREEVWAGNAAFAVEMGAPLSPAQQEVLSGTEARGRTGVLVGWGGQVRGLLAVADTLRPGAAQALQALRAAGVTHVAMLTGDNATVAQAIAAEAGVDVVYANLLPEQKVDAVRELARKYGPVAMVGDGVNDAPALATASVGIAMGGGGTDVALETADIVLMGDELEKISYAIYLGRQTMRVVWQNLAWALGVIAVAVVLALFDQIVLAVGVVAHEGSTVVAMLNGLRMLPYKPPVAATGGQAAAGEAELECLGSARSVGSPGK